MDLTTCEILRKLNNDFYASQSASFSATRQTPWDGWRECAHVLKTTGLDDTDSLSVFNLAAGNLRFEAFLMQSFPQIEFDFYTIDNCDSLVPQEPITQYQSLDILEMLYSGESLHAHLVAPPCDLSVSFGFMHHVPTYEHRLAVLDALLRQTVAGGHVIVSFWQFMKNESLAKKARAMHARASQELRLPALDEGDYLLDWQNKPGTYRYCHSFSEGEIDNLLEDVSDRTRLTARFSADGRSGNLNTYLILHKR